MSGRTIAFRVGRCGCGRRCRRWERLDVGLDRRSVEEAADVGDWDGVFVVVRFGALVVGTVVPGLAAFAGVADQGLGVQGG